MMGADKIFRQECRPVIRAGSADITPKDMSLALAGYGSKAYATVSAERLEINCIWFGGNEDGIILASIDCLFAGNDIRTAIARYSGLPEEAVILAASHTHYAPALERTKPGLGQASEEWLAFVDKSLARLVGDLKTKPAEPFATSAGKTGTSAGINRRLWWPFPHLGSRRQPLIGPGVKNAPNPAAQFRNDLRTSLLQDSGGRPLALLWTIACHPNRYHAANVISSDFTGHVRKRLRGGIGENLPVLFLQGFSGNIVPRPVSPTKQNLFKKILFGPQPKYLSKAEWTAWAEGIAESAEKALKGAGPPQISSADVELAGVKFDLGKLVPGAAHGEAEMLRLRFGGFDCLLVSAEVVNEYEDKLPESIWPAGCANDVYGYWPTSRQIGEGGYEVSGFLGPFGLPGKLTADTDAVFVEYAGRLGLQRGA
jgi:hypothetical protein